MTALVVRHEQTLKLLLMLALTLLLLALGTHVAARAADVVTAPEVRPDTGKLTPLLKDQLPQPSAAESAVLAPLGEVSSKAKLPFGLEVHNLTPELARRYRCPEIQGVIVTEVQSGTIADLAGLRAGALILEVNERQVANVDQFQELLRTARNPNKILLRVRQDEATPCIVLTQP